jgi:GNAT superfamily N-acetyltransferase
MPDHERANILAAHAALVAEGAVEPLSQDTAETRLWLDCELASLVENRFFEPLDPGALTAAERALWEPRASSDEPLSSPHGHEWYRIPYWIREAGERAGTIALATSYMGMRLVTVSSLYVLPSHRRRGVAARALRRAQDAVRAHAHPNGGLRIPAYWTWQPAVRFYLDLGLWVSNWKHSLVFAWRDDLPPYRIEGGEREARFSVAREGAWEPLLVATRDGREGHRLGWTELGEGRPASAHYAAQTFAVALAVRGFPLIRSPEAWARRHASCDGGEPEGLAYKVEVFEAWDRKSGFTVRTPRIPGLTYRDWDAID